mmetsp:Transcript_114831/g.364949  ORF Transcript_114831/g.364949 Transcript_114831/m.364949 type:complete len:206 (+) Transcript_114831:1484-2101(+)
MRAWLRSGSSPRDGELPPQLLSADSIARRQPLCPATSAGGASPAMDGAFSCRSGDGTVPCQCPRRSHCTAEPLPNFTVPSRTTKMFWGIEPLASGANSTNSMDSAANASWAADHVENSPDFWKTRFKKDCCKRIGLRSCPMVCRRRRTLTRKTSHLLTASAVMLKGSSYSSTRSQIQLPGPSNTSSDLPSCALPATIRNLPDFTR